MLNMCSLDIMILKPDSLETVVVFGGESSFRSAGLVACFQPASVVVTKAMLQYVRVRGVGYGPFRIVTVGTRM